MYLLSGVVTRNFTLSDQPPLGDWYINVVGKVRHNRQYLSFPNQDLSDRVLVWYILDIRAKGIIWSCFSSVGISVVINIFNALYMQAYGHSLTGNSIVYYLKCLCHL